MNVMLISPYPDIYSYGLRVLSACLKKKGHNVRFLSMPKEFMQRYDSNTLSLVLELSRDVDLVGISLMTNFFENVVQITQRIKEKYSIPILWGGIHPTVRPEESLNYADMICIGESEISLVELVQKMEAEQDYHDTRGVWFNNKGKIIRNMLPDLVHDLDSIPFQDYDLEDHYVLQNGCLRECDNNQLERYFRRRTYVTMPTRGCPFSCAYCCNNVFDKMYNQKKKVRKRTIDNVIEELKEARIRMPFIEKVKFDDDAFLSYSIQQIDEFNKKYKQDIGIPLFITGVTPTTITREKISLLVDAGLFKIRMGIETGSDRARKLYNRKHTNQQVEKAALIIKEFKDQIGAPGYDIILDNPWEADEDLIETLMLLSRLPVPYRLTLFSLAFYPGTEMYDKAKEDGIITNDLVDVYSKYFLDCKKTYLNNLFFLQNEYAIIGIGISPRIMILLTNKNLRQIKLSWLIYAILKSLLYPIRRVVRINYLCNESLKIVQKRDWGRIRRSFLNRKKHV